MDVDGLNESLKAAEAETKEEEIPDLTDKETEEIAATLAQDELFQKAANQSARRFVFKKRFPHILEEHAAQVSDIIDHAKGFFEVQIKPKLERAIEKQIHDLAREGLNKDQIAKKLRLPVSRVKRVL